MADPIETLRPGARVGIFAPSHHFNPERLERGLAVLEGWGFEPVPSANLRAKHRWFAGTDEQRLADLQWALSDPGLDAAWMARGGSGMGRLLDRLDWSRVRPRPVVGFSDGTALHIALRQRAGVAGVHGPVITSLGDTTDSDSADWLRALLGGEPLAALGGRVLVEGACEGPLVGGNLAVVASLCGTRDQLDARGCVLLFEDIGEFGYRIDRTLQQLAASGVFDGIAGVALGEFLKCPMPSEDTLDVIVREYFGDRGVPVVVDLPVGHGPANRAFRFGAACRLSAGPEGGRLSWGAGLV